MRRLTLLVIVAAMFPLVASGFAGDAEKKKNPADTFQGEWSIVFIRFARYELKGASEQPLKVSFSKNRMVTNPGWEINSSKSFWFDSNGFHTNKSTTISLLERDQERIFRLDPSKTPAEIDFEEKRQKEVLKTKGIYRMTKDGLEICVGGTWTRPREFKASTSAILLRLKRKEKKD